ncbi:MAG: lamin tail domain-containing protein [Chloroflexota bacterium]
MKRPFTMLAVAALLGLSLAASPATAPDVSAAPCIQIYRIYFDSPGADSGSNSSLNAEWIQLRNRCSSAKSLTGWTVRDTSSHIYRFGSFSLGAGASVRLHTGKGTNTAGHRYWASRYYIWNNNGDRATVKNAAGTVIDRCSFSGAGSAVYC